MVCAISNIGLLERGGGVVRSRCERELICVLCVMFLQSKALHKKSGAIATQAAAAAAKTTEKVDPREAAGSGGADTKDGDFVKSLTAKV